MALPRNQSSWSSLSRMLKRVLFIYLRERDAVPRQVMKCLRCRALPGLAWPSRATPHQACVAKPRRVLPCLATPSLRYLAGPRPASPRRACAAAPCLTAPGLASPCLRCRALSGLTVPRPALPKVARPTNRSRACRHSWAANLMTVSWRSRDCRSSATRRACSASSVSR